MPPSRKTGASRTTGRSADASQAPFSAVSPDVPCPPSVGTTIMAASPPGEYTSRAASVTSVLWPSANLRPYSTPFTGMPGSLSTFTMERVSKT